MNGIATGNAVLHPAAVLYPGGSALPSIPCVDHYAGSEKLMRKSLALQAERGPLFDITFDCEDGAAAGNERAHAELACTLVNSDDNRHGRVGLRCHDVTHPHWQSDLEIAVAECGERLAFVTLPKARKADDVSMTLDTLRTLESRHRVTRWIPLHVLVETHGALREVWKIAALDGVQSLDFGLMDFVSEHAGALPASTMTSPGQFDHPLLRRAKCEIAAAALANDVIPTHNVCTTLDDAARVHADAERARNEFAFLRMWSIHPMQIDPILRAMQPAQEEVGIASEIIARAQAAQWAPISHAGRLHDRASYRYYWQVLERARNTGVALPPAAAHLFPATETLQ